ncbi:uncharacterized protein A4U43_C07F24920 [Asparagus officinalis]|uniref:Uncharacterized protein n=1 Tax=Asparagus officinalis TaxID=4686 RepID=A0A5P1EER4_ASPOF|nr:uncharacterized protein A4U43_C07F24920 [Asparagus officinalis]
MAEQRGRLREVWHVEGGEEVKGQGWWGAVGAGWCGWRLDDSKVGGDDGERQCQRVEAGPYLDMYLNELCVLTGTNTASPFQWCLEVAKRDVQEFLDLRSKDVIAQAVENV